MSGPSTDVPNAPSEHGKPEWPDTGQDADGGSGRGDGNDSADAESVPPGQPGPLPTTPPPPD